MRAIDDMELLREYATRHSEEAFATLVTRHIDLVYSTALRHTRNHHQAQEITQAVFVVLARKAPSLNPRTVLAGWLFQTARLTAANHVRGEMRRARREQEACMQSDPNERDEDTWKQVTPMLNEIIGGLREKDRDAVVLRFLQGRSYQQVAAALGATEEAAQMRVTRALEKMRQMFARRGVVLSAAALGGAIAAQGTQAAPAGLAAPIAAGAVHGAATTTAAVIATTKTIAMTTFQKTLVTATMVVLTGAGIYEARQAAQQRDQVQTLQQQQAPLAEQIQQLQNDFGDATNQLANVLAENSRLKSNPNRTELLKLRGQVAAASRAAADAAAKTRDLSNGSEQSPGQADDLRNQTRAHLDTFFKLTNLSREKADQYVTLEVEMKRRQDERMKALLGGTLSAAEAALQRDQDNQEQQNQRREILGPDGWATLQSIADGMREGVAKRLIGTVQAGMVNTPLTQDQSDRLQNAIKTEVAANTMDDTDLFRPLDEWTQMVTDHQEHVLRAAAEFLTSAQQETFQYLEKANLALLLQQREQRRKALGIGINQ